MTGAVGNVVVSVEGRTPEQCEDVWPRLLALITELRAIPGIHARIDIGLTVTMSPIDGSGT